MLSNEYVSVNQNYEVGDAVIITDHINFMPEHPLRGKNYDELGPRFVDMSEPYDRKMIVFVSQFGEENGIEIKKGIHRSEEHTSELQSRGHFVCCLLLDKK